MGVNKAHSSPQLCIPPHYTCNVLQTGQALPHWKNLVEIKYLFSSKLTIFSEPSITHCVSIFGQMEFSWLVISVCLCELGGYSDVSYPPLLLWTWTDIGWFMLANITLFFLAFICSSIHILCLWCVFRWLNNLVCVDLQCKLFAYEVFLVNISCAKSEVLPNSR